MNKLIILKVLVLFLVLPLQAQKATKSSIEKSDRTHQTENRTQPLSGEKFTLVKLPYATNALEPVISQRTVELHHGKHLQGYVNKLNKLIKGTPFSEKDLITIVKESDGSLFDNAGQNLNHILYFLQFSPQGGGEPKGNLLQAIKRTYGTFEEFKEEFEKQALSLFGSGWAWLACNKEGSLEIIKEANAGNPVTKDLIPLLGIDVWEHAYYLDYENKRGEHLKKVWNIIDWKIIEARYNNRTKRLNIQW
ncbi:superoxide dismutase [Porphyromonas circumdentaria]|uniref:Superoxide dismutase n=1 Tax=Porphyromonas circumdentaria TaxID=29524 RepID=A0A1T4L0V0_9PORP|nr:superoxide dismutase [Porphyromonas circumdentaria]MBB6275167.1 Fe-Mn family superoxide dismutase [Porphyromonas circumdentaria]MDO4721797.1 superoxide dismutase [Porphyromonas circumdentaria]SJZ48160.1 superoxide dismutase, Fe-Mn family [Porphyromonas circumdentaria]